MLHSDLSLSTLGIGNQLLLPHFCKPVHALAEKQDCETKEMVWVVILISNQVVRYT
jgi:hypothetical protein